MKRDHVIQGGWRRLQHQHGISIAEMMVSIALSLLVVLAATTILMASKSGHTSVDEGTRLQDAGRYALDIIGRNVRQTAYEQWDRPAALVFLPDRGTANIAGLDASILDEARPGVNASTTAARSVKSDVLALRFFGSGTGSGGDGSVLNCGGHGVAAPTSGATASAERGWSIFYVKDNSSGEPELVCKYSGDANGGSDAIVSGVESFQVLYGLDTSADGQGIPTRYVGADEIKAMDDALTSTATFEEFRKLDVMRRSNWRKVVAVRVALLMRGTQRARVNELADQYDLFGKNYSDENGTVDAGSKVLDTDIDAAQRDRLRKIFTATFLIRNRVQGGGQ